MTKNNKKGFTIIEVVLVLAIAGLIFMMVFVALPSLQSSQRNTQRADDMTRVFTAIAKYQTNNSGKTPWDAGTNDNNVKFIHRYVDEGFGFSGTYDSITNLTDEAKLKCGDSFKDPDGTCYNIVFGGTVSDGNNAKTQFGTTIKAGDDLTDDSVELGTQQHPFEFNHVIFAFTNAGCGDEGTLKVGEGKREVALMMAQEGGAIICNDNH